MTKMLRATVVLMLLLVVFWPRVAYAQAEGGERIVVRVENPLAMAREEVAALAWPEAQRRLPALAEGNVRMRDAASGREVTTQRIDVDADGSIDQLLFWATVQPGASHAYVLEAAPSSIEAAARVDARYDEERDDVAWESARIAYRTYGQGLWEADAYAPLNSSGIDVWLKRTDDLILEKWYAAGHDAYHRDLGEGADFYSVGPTLGAGGTAIWTDGTMHRAENFADYRILADGPLRTIFELTYEPWQAGGREVSEVKRVTMDAGENLFRAESTFESAATDSLTYVMGFVQRAEGVVGSLNQTGRWAWLSAWGPVERKLGGHGELGTAGLIHGARLAKVREAKNHYLAFAHAAPGETVTHYIGAGWTASGDFEDTQDWWVYLDAFAQRLEAPLRVTMQSGDALTSQASE